MSEWQPIKTAPKDGTRILIYEPFGSWKGFRGTQETVTEAYWHQPGNHKHAGFWQVHWAHKVRPTHWMPLPEPPK